MHTILLLSLFSLFSVNVLHAQTYNIVIKNGHVIDPKNGIDGIVDIAISNGKIARVEKNIDGRNALQMINAKGFFVTPGLIDIHVHVPALHTCRVSLLYLP